jgi:hypothetical protein
MGFIHVGKRRNVLLFGVSIFRKSRYLHECDLSMSERKPCQNCSLLRIWRVYISYVMLTIALRVKANKIPPIPPYLF